MTGPTNKIVGYALAATAFIACPCHLALTLPLALALLGGTALGAALTAHTGLLVAAVTVYFLGALASAIYLLNRPSKDEEQPPDSSEESGAHAYTRSRSAQESRSGVDR